MSPAVSYPPTRPFPPSPVVAHELRTHPTKLREDGIAPHHNHLLSFKGRRWSQRVPQRAGQEDTSMRSLSAQRSTLLFSEARSHDEAPCFLLTTLIDVFRNVRGTAISSKSCLVLRPLRCVACFAAPSDPAFGNQSWRRTAACVRRLDSHLIFFPSARASSLLLFNPSLSSILSDKLLDSSG